MTTLQVLTRAQWQARAQSYAQEVDARTHDHRSRRVRGESHPVSDFLFDYYPIRPGRLRRWHPGVGVTLCDAPEFAANVGYRRSTHGDHNAYEVDPDCFTSGDLSSRRDGYEAIVELLRATASRPARHGCFGLHEWAMVDGLEPSQVRHRQVPLRVSPQQIRRTIDDVGLRCTHYDAFRFFTSRSAPDNALQLTRENQITHEQPGCIHAGMDLYKWAYKLQPLVSSELLLACFDHAWRAREIDMRASPYELRYWGYPPIAIETVEGRQEYLRLQRSLADSAATLRAALLAAVSQPRNVRESRVHVPNEPSEGQEPGNSAHLA